MAAQSTRPPPRTAVLSVTGQRDHNEDVGRVLHGEAGDEPVTLLLVADGMGGHAHGEVASRLAAEALEGLWRQLLADLAPPGADRETIARAFLREAFVNAGGSIRREARGSGMGTTLVAGLAWGDRALLANIGDSRAYLVRDGGAELLTHDHSVVADAVRQGAITPEEAERSPYQHALTRALDGRSNAEPDLFPASGSLALGPASVLLLCSDGLSGVMKPADLHDRLARTPDLASGARALVAAALDRGSPDNVTVALLETGALARADGPPLAPEAVLPEASSPAASPALEAPAPEARDVRPREAIGRTPWVLGALALALLAIAAFVWSTRSEPRDQSQRPEASEAVPVRPSAFRLAQEGNALTWQIRGVSVPDDSVIVTVSRGSLSRSVAARGGRVPLAEVAAAWSGGVLPSGEYLWSVEARSASGSRLRSSAVPLILRVPTRASGAETTPQADAP